MNCQLLKQVRVIDPVSQRDQIADILVIDGYIRTIESQINDYPENTQIINSKGLILGPGLVDLYSHSGEPGFEERESLNSLLNAAGAGGFTRLAILPNTIPAIDNPATVTLLKERSQKVLINSGFSVPKLYVWGALTQDVASQQMTELNELADAGIVGFSDGQPLQNLALLRRILEYLKPLNKPLALYCCDRTLVVNGVMREGHDSILSGLPGIPDYAETAALAALLELVEVTGTPVHIMRVSTARSVELIAQAKARDLPITASTTWIHLLLNTTSINRIWNQPLEDSETLENPTLVNSIPLPYDPNLRLDPPLGNPADQKALIQGIETGIIDAIAIDHTPYSYEEKTVAFSDAPPGSIGLELALPLLWKTFVESGRWSALDLWRVLSSQPAFCLQQTPPSIQPDQPAEMILFDPQHPWTVNANTLKSRSVNTPWLGQKLTGQVIKTWCPT
ncbi:putative dihydroorotase-like protein [Planktothrix serta PCC 8927]|uniref:Dihydroorotase-like protein n=1 Tax=Planktothrix serta PCC 8927 TaxID=671068 RepID=A0A7Z9DUT4_9CYAN|nr:dihydroorotase [Planktothrix serta]VXD11265.1 putative dihydroorotase-like protein [Planktothrix serta PCC 8927]